MKLEYKIPQFTVDGTLFAGQKGGEYVELIILTGLPSKYKKGKFTPSYRPVVKLIISREAGKDIKKNIDNWLKKKK